MKKLLLLLLGITLSYVSYAQRYHDAAMFNAPYGHIKSIEYKEGCVYFTDNGLIALDSSSYISGYKKYNIKHNSEGYPIELITDIDHTLFEYDSEWRIIKRTLMAPKRIIYDYTYRNDGTVHITTTEYEGGTPHKTGTIYDLNFYDGKGNWTQKGTKGKEVVEQEVTQFNSGTVGDPHIHTHVLNHTKIVGRKSEQRDIRYYHNFIFQRSASPYEISIIDAIDDPLFLGVGNDIKKIDKIVKNNGYEYKKGYSGFREVSIKECNKVFYGFPIKNIYCKYNKSGYISVYSFEIEIKDKNKKTEFYGFLKDILEEKGTTGHIQNNNIFVLTYYNNNTRKNFGILETDEGILVKRSMNLWK